MTVRTALVTGANRGLGRAVAAELRRRGLNVVLTARAAADATEAAAELGIGAARLDVTDVDSVRAAAERVGPVDVLVCNAGVLLDAGRDPLNVDLELVEETFRVNLLGGWRVAQAFVPGMVARGWGRVVFVSSGTGSFHNGIFPGTPGYSVSKTAVNGLVTMLARVTAGSGVLVNAVNPGLTRTRMMPDAPRAAAESAVDVADAATVPDDGPSGVFLRGNTHIDW